MAQLTAVSLQKELIKFIENDTELLRYASPGSTEGKALHVYAQRLPISAHSDEDEAGELDESESHEAETEESDESESHEAETEESDEDFFPFVIVKVTKGQVYEPGETYKATVLIIAGIYDPKDDNEGDVRVMTLLERLMLQLIQQGDIGQSWSLARYNDNVPMIRWKISEDDTDPYYFGGIEAQFETIPPANLQGKEFT